MRNQKTVATVIRIVFGLLFLAHGVNKFQMGLSNVAGWFGSMGVPSTLGYIVAYLELLGGIALIIGIGTRYVAAILGIMLIGAIFTVKLPLGLLGTNGAAGYEMDIAYLLVALYLVFGGEPGYSVDSAMRRGKTRRS